MNTPFNLLNTGGRRANMLSRDHSLASIPVSPPQKKCDDTINDSPWGRRRRRTTDVLSRPMLKVNFGGSDGGPSIQYFPAPESGRSDEELNECVYTVSVFKTRFLDPFLFVFNQLKINVCYCETLAES